MRAKELMKNLKKETKSSQNIIANQFNLISGTHTLAPQMTATELVSEEKKTEKAMSLRSGAP